jgi:hypothetical protein
MGEWQPIETAPKDGTPILLWRKPSGHPSVKWATIIPAAWVCFVDEDEIEEGFATPDEPFFDAYSRDAYQAAMNDDDHYLVTSATHWMPLPDPPLSLSGEE